MQPTPNTPSPVWSDELKRIIGLIAFVVLMLFLYQFRGILPLVFTAIVFAYLLYPIAMFFHRTLLRGKMRGLAVVLTFLLMISIVAVSLLVVIPALIEQIQSLLAGAPQFLRNIQNGLLTLLQREINFTQTPLERIYPEPFVIAEVLGIDMSEDGVLAIFDVLVNQIRNFDVVAIARQVSGSVTNITGSAFSFVGGAFSLVLNLVFLLTMMFYLMIDGENMITALSKAVPDGYQDDVRRILRELGFVWNAYLRGQIILSLVMGIAMYTLASILGIPNAVFLGIFAGLMEFIPNLGPTLAMIPAATLALFSASSTIAGLEGIVFALVVIAAWTVLQQIEAVVLIPRIVGDSLNLHPFVVMVAVLGGISVGGIFAVLIAAPVVASLRLIAQYVYGKLTGRAIFPVEHKTAQDIQKERRPLLVRAGDYFAQRVRTMISSRSVTKRR